MNKYKMKELKYQHFKESVCCKLNENNTCILNENFGILIKSTKNVDKIKELIKKYIPLEGILYQHCCKSNLEEIRCSF